MGFQITTDGFASFGKSIADVIYQKKENERIQAYNQGRTFLDRLARAGDDELPALLEEANGFLTTQFKGEPLDTANITSRSQLAGSVLQRMGVAVPRLTTQFQDKLSSIIDNIDDDEKAAAFVSNPQITEMLTQNDPTGFAALAVQTAVDAQDYKMAKDMANLFITGAGQASINATVKNKVDKAWIESPDGQAYWEELQRRELDTYQKQMNIQEAKELRLQRARASATTTADAQQKAMDGLIGFFHSQAVQLGTTEKQIDADETDLARLMEKRDDIVNSDAFQKGKVVMDGEYLEAPDGSRISTGELIMSHVALSATGLDMVKNEEDLMLSLKRYHGIDITDKDTLNKAQSMLRDGMNKLPAETRSALLNYIHIGKEIQETADERNILIDKRDVIQKSLEGQVLQLQQDELFNPMLILGKYKPDENSSRIGEILYNILTPGTEGDLPQKPYNKERPLSFPASMSKHAPSLFKSKTVEEGGMTIEDTIKAIQAQNNVLQQIESGEFVGAPEKEITGGGQRARNRSKAREDVKYNQVVSEVENQVRATLTSKEVTDFIESTIKNQTMSEPEKTLTIDKMLMRVRTKAADTIEERTGRYPKPSELDVVDRIWSSIYRLNTPPQPETK